MGKINRGYIVNGKKLIRYLEVPSTSDHVNSMDELRYGCSQSRIDSLLLYNNFAAVPLILQCILFKQNLCKYEQEKIIIDRFIMNIMDVVVLVMDIIHLRMQVAQAMVILIGISISMMVFRKQILISWMLKEILLPQRNVS